MSQFWYNSTLEEWWLLVESILKVHALRFAVDRMYPEAYCDYYEHLAPELRQTILDSKRNIFIVGDEFSHKPLYFRHQKSGPNSGKYSIDLARGGPWIRMSMPIQFKERSLFWFAPGDLTIQDLYWDDSLTQAYPPSKELKNVFASIRKTLQNHLKEKMIYQQMKWISSEAWQLFESGNAVFRVDGKCYTKNGEVSPPTVWQRPKNVTPQ